MRLEAWGIGVGLGGRPVLVDVDVAVDAGELLAVVGPNGAGKSTLLAVLAGDLVPDTGRVLLDGRPLSATSTRGLARRRGVLVQRTSVAFGFRVREVVEMGRAPWRGTPREPDDAAAVRDAMETADVAWLAHRRHPTLSGGEAARTAFARVLAQEPEVLLLDEPTAALDIHHQEQVLASSSSRVSAGAAVVAVLHDLSVAAAWADQVLVLGEGRVQAFGPPNEVLTAALLSRVYRHPVSVLEHHGRVVVVPERQPQPEQRRRGVPL